MKDNQMTMLLDRKGNGVFEFMLGVVCQPGKVAVGVGVVRSMSVVARRVVTQFNKAVTAGTELETRTIDETKRAAAASYAAWLAFYSPLSGGDRLCEIRPIVARAAAVVAVVVPMVQAVMF